MIPYKLIGIATIKYFLSDNSLICCINNATNALEDNVNA